jgi:N-acetylmuramoyl-L-alanine amidase
MTLFRITASPLRTLALLLVALPAMAQWLPGRVEGGLRLLYPRPGRPEGPIVMPDQDSLLVNGNLQLPRPGKEVPFRLNGFEIELEEDGRFAAQIPFPRDRRLDFRWGSGFFRHEHTVLLAPPDPPSASVEIPAAPGWYRTTGRLNLSTAPGASYWLFPAVGTALELTGPAGGGSTVRLCDGLEGWIPEDAPLTHLASPPRRPLSVGSPRPSGDGLRIPVPGGPLPLRLEPEPSLGRARLLLPDAVSAIDRVRLDPDGMLRHLDWEPRPGPELELRLAWAPGRVDGIGLDWQGSDLLLALNERECGFRDWRIVLDPGHGGVELGCVGASGTTEAEVNLLLAFELGRLLEQRGARVYYTRTDDRQLGLPERVAFADSVQADFFLSVHHNSTFPDGDPRASRGYTVFYWNAFSAEPARAMHAALLPGPLADDGLLWRSLAVCRQEGRPALLLELGYLIHPHDEDLILDPRTRSHIAGQIVEGLRHYLEHPE